MRRATGEFRTVREASAPGARHPAVPAPRPGAIRSTPIAPRGQPATVPRGRGMAPPFVSDRRPAVQPGNDRSLGYIGSMSPSFLSTSTFPAFPVGRVVSALLFLVAISAFPSLAAPDRAAASSPGDAATLQASLPSAPCANSKWRNITFRKRPRTCDFVQRGAPIAHAWMVLTHAMRWNKWSSRRAFGTGRHHINQGPPRGVPIQVWLMKPKTLCGRRVFTVLRARVRTRLTPPYGRWRKWGPRFPLSACRR